MSWLRSASWSCTFAEFYPEIFIVMEHVLILSAWLLPVESPEPFYMPASLFCRCEWHQEQVDINDCIQNGKRFKCRSCYSTERFLQTQHKKENRSHEWQGLSTEERRSLILRNRSRGTGHGKKREFDVTETVTVKDKVKTGAKFPFLNRKEYLDSSNYFFWHSATDWHWLFIGSIYSILAPFLCT